MSEEALTAVYLVHRRSDHEFREWIIMPGAGVMPVNVWTRYVAREGARPIWRATGAYPMADPDQRATTSERALDQISTAVAGHDRQNLRNGPDRQWVWDVPIVVETSVEEIAKFANKTPYPVLRRVDRVKSKRARAAESVAGS